MLRHMPYQEPLRKYTGEPCRTFDCENDVTVKAGH